MRKIKILIFMLLMLAFPLTAHALSLNLDVSCPSTAQAGDTIQCLVTGSSDGTITGLSAKVSITGSASVAGFDRDSSLWMDTEGSLKNDGVTIFTTASGNGVSGNFNVGTLSLKIADNASASSSIAVTFTNVSYCDENDVDYTNNYTVGSTSVTVADNGGGDEPVANDKGLSSLSCSSGGVLSPQFSEDNEGYTLFLNSADTTSFSISAVAKNSSDPIEVINGDTGETLNPSHITFKTVTGKAVMYVVIFVGEGDSKARYWITVSKPSTKVGALSSLTVGGKTVNLTKGVYEYTVALGNVSSFTIQATVADSDNFIISNSSEVLNKTFTDSAIYSIIVDPKDSSSGYSAQTYLITVTKSGSSANVTPTPTEPTVNPKTGTTSAVIIGLMLVVSLFVTLNLYKKNIQGYNKESK